jgi:hypothetical protein
MNLDPNSTDPMVISVNAVVTALGDLAEDCLIMPLTDTTVSIVAPYAAAVRAGAALGRARGLAYGRTSSRTFFVTVDPSTAGGAA